MLLHTASAANKRWRVAWLVALALVARCETADPVGGECGNGIVEEGEVCDDGNTVDGDDCRSDCGQDLTTCGNGVAEPERGETCDDGNTVDSDGCSATCQIEPCGPDNCALGCCNALGGCETGVRDVACGIGGQACEDCLATEQGCVEHQCQSLPACNPGESAECGNCGTQTCDASGQWGSCEGEGECTPDAAETGAACGDCGREERTCTDLCNWTSWTCIGEGVCSPGEEETQACGPDGCGLQARECSALCQWGDWSLCAGGGQVTVSMTAYDGQQRQQTECESSVFVIDYPGSYASNCPAARCRWDLSKGGVKAYFKSVADCATSAEGSYMAKGSCSAATVGGDSVICCAN